MRLILQKPQPQMCILNLVMAQLIKTRTINLEVLNIAILNNYLCFVLKNVFKDVLTCCLSLSCSLQLFVCLFLAHIGEVRLPLFITNLMIASCITVVLNKFQLCINYFNLVFELQLLIFKLERINNDEMFCIAVLLLQFLKIVFSKLRGMQ